MPRFDVKSDCKTFDVGQRDVPAGALNGRHVCAIKLAFHCQVFLGPTLLHPQQPNVVGQHTPQVARIGQSCWWLGLR